MGQYRKHSHIHARSDEWVHVHRHGQNHRHQGDNNAGCALVGGIILFLLLLFTLPDFLVLLIVFGIVASFFLR